MDRPAQGDEGELLELVTWEQPNQRFVALCPLWHDKPFPFEAQLQMLAYHGWTVKESSLRWFRQVSPSPPGTRPDRDLGHFPVRSW